MREFTPWDGVRAQLLRPKDVDKPSRSSTGIELVEDRDLTPFLEFDRPRDRALGLLIALTRPFVLDECETRKPPGGQLPYAQCLKRSARHLSGTGSSRQARSATKKSS